MAERGLGIGKRRRLSVYAIVFFLLVAAVCVIIFMFSSQDGTVSSVSSGRITQIVTKLFFPRYEMMTPAEQLIITDKVTTVIRKGAHFSEYMILAQLAFQLFLTLPRPRTDIIAALLGFGFAALYAVSDEYHQSFVPGRNMAVTDVLIDILGALLGIFIVLMVLRTQRRAKKNT